MQAFELSRVIQPICELLGTKPHHSNQGVVGQGIYKVFLLHIGGAPDTKKSIPRYICCSQDKWLLILPPRYLVVETFSINLSSTTNLTLGGHRLCMPCANQYYKRFSRVQFYNTCSLLAFIHACTIFWSFCNECSKSATDGELH